MKSPPKARANVTGKTERSLASTMPMTGRPSPARKVSFFAWSTSSSSVAAAP